MKKSPIKTYLRSIACLIALVLAGAYAYVSLRGPSGLPALQEKQRQIRELREQNADLAKQIQEKRQRITKLQASESEQELEIRRKLKLLKQKETTFILRDQQK